MAELKKTIEKLQEEMRKMQEEMKKMQDEIDIYDRDGSTVVRATMAFRTFSEQMINERRVMEGNHSQQIAGLNEIIREHQMVIAALNYQLSNDTEVQEQNIRNLIARYESEIKELQTKLEQAEANARKEEEEEKK